MSKGTNLYHTLEEAEAQLERDQLPRYVDTGGWGYYKIIERFQATENEKIIHDQRQAIADQDK